MAVDGGNRDFRILDPEWLQAAIYVVLAGLTGVVAAVFQPRVERRLAAPQPGIVIGYWAVVIVGALLGIPMLGLFFMTGGDCACVSPPWLVGLLLIALGIVWLVRFVVEAKGRTVSTGLITSGRIVLFAAVVAGLFHLGGEIAHFT